MYTRNSCDCSVFICAECLIINNTVTPGLEDRIWLPRTIFVHSGTSAVLINSSVRTVLAIEATRRLLLRKHPFDSYDLLAKLAFHVLPALSYAPVLEKTMNLLTWGTSPGMKAEPASYHMLLCTPKRPRECQFCLDTTWNPQHQR